MTKRPDRGSISMDIPETPIIEHLQSTPGLTIVETLPSENVSEPSNRADKSFSSEEEPIVKLPTLT